MTVKEIDKIEVEKLAEVIIEFENKVSDEIKIELPPLPNNRIEIEKFRGGETTDNKMDELYLKTPTMEDFLKTQNLYKVVD